VAFLAIDLLFWPSTFGTTGTISGFILIGLLALAAASLILVIQDTVKLHGRHPSVRRAAADRTPHHPVYAHPFRPPQHRTSYAFAWVFLALWMGLVVALLPQQVNGIAYLAGAGNSVTFLPQSYCPCYARRCGHVTDGVLETHPPVSATWSGQVALGQPFEVREPFWDGWGSPALMDGSDSVGAIIYALIFDVPAVIVVAVLIHLAWRRRPQQLRRAPRTRTA
jgi:hypothetical protein